LTIALFVSFPVIGLDQFLRTSPAQFSAQPAPAIGHWIADSLMAVPLFAIGILAGDWIAGRAGLRTGRRGDAVKRAMLISLLSALVMAPAWFQVDRTDDPVTAQPLVFPHASDSGDVYWVGSGVIVALACACLLPLAAWAGHAITRGQSWRPLRLASASRATAALLLVAAVPVAAWLLHQAAERAYASRVYDTRAQPREHLRPHQVQPSTASSSAASPGAPAAPASPAVSAAPDAFAYQAAHALQDGLAGQAAGLPVAVVALTWGARILQGRDEKSQHQLADA
jgi:hypothetical protein